MVLLKHRNVTLLRRARATREGERKASFSSFPSCVRPQNFSLARPLVRNNHVEAVERFSELILKHRNVTLLRRARATREGERKASFSSFPSCVRPQNFSLARPLVRNNHVEAMERFSELMAKSQCF